MKLLGNLLLFIVFCICLNGYTNPEISAAQTNKVLNDDVLKLLDVLRDRNSVVENPEKLAKAIEELGQRQVSEAIPDLIKYLNFRRIHKWEGSGMILHPIPKEGDYPVVGALFSIGKPALPALVKVIEEKDTSSIENKNALKVIQLIFRDDLFEGVKYLENAVGESKTQDGQQRLQNALEKTREEWIKTQNSMPN